MLLRALVCVVMIVGHSAVIEAWARASSADVHGPFVGSAVMVGQSDEAHRLPTVAPSATGRPAVEVIEQLYHDGITGGCATNPLRYCPDDSVTRAQMAVFLLRAKHGAGYTPPPATGTVFGDVPASDSFAPWIERLAVEGITSGCGGGNYCPTQAVTRAQMAIFLVRAFNLPV